MRILLLAAGILFAAVPSVSAQSFAEIEADGALTGKLNLEKSFSDEDGIYLWTMGDKDWAEVLGGFWVKPYPWMKMYLGFGVETADHIARYGFTLWLGNDKLSALTIFEDGGSGKWYKHTSTVAMRRVRIGLISQSSIGTGPLVEVPLPKKFGVSGGLAYDSRNLTPIVALNKGF